MKINRYMILGLIALLFLLYTVLFNMKPQDLIEADLMPYSPDGFTDSEELSDTNHLVSENALYQLYFDETTSYFRVVEKATGVEWLSNPVTNDPWEDDDTKTITNSALERQNSTLLLSYFNHTGALASINNYKYSIYHPESILEPEGLRSYKVKYIENGFQVVYVIEDMEIDYLYFPKFLKPEVMETLDNRNVLEAIAYTGFDEELGVYEIVQYEGMSKLVKKRLYDTFYGDDGLGYTREQAIEENADYGYTETFEKVRFEIGVQVTLTEQGVETSILHDSIVEPDNVKLASVSLYPMFGTAVSEVAGVPQNGYIVLPDGSGAVMEFNNGKSYQQPYIKRLYGEDLALLDYKMPEVQEKISIPLYGMVKEGVGAFAAIITQGDAMASIHADVSGRIDSYNKVFTSFMFRENESVTLGSGYNQYGIDLWTKERVRSDFSVQYTFLDASKASYVDIANVYRTYLENTTDFTVQDVTSNTVLTAEFIGAYDHKQFVMGIPYTSNESLTTFEQAEEILDLMMDMGITHINIQYTGMMNGGLSTDVNDHFDVEKDVGSRREYRAFLNYAEEHDMDVYPTLRLMIADDYQKMFDRFRYTSSRIDGSQSLLFNYHLPSKLPYSETSFGSAPNEYVINPRFLREIIGDFTKDYDQNTIAFDLFGSILGGDYTENDLTYKQDAKRIEEDILEQLNEQLMLNNPLAFALPYADYITDLPTETTLYAILDYQIPLLQLILSGYVDYSTVSLNLSNVRSTQYNFLKVLETGSNVKYTLSYDDSRELRDTAYNYYLSTQYNNWLDTMASTVSELDQIGIHSGHLVDHEVLQNNVVEVTYSHGLSIIINYNLSAVVIGGVTIDPLDYYIVEVD